MNILLCSVPFRPSVGGIETVSAILAEQFATQGHRVVLVTQTPASGAEGSAFEVVRRPNGRRLLALVAAADVVFHNNVSLRLAWPQLWLRRPWVVAHHMWTPRRGTVAGRLKHFAFRYARHIAVSKAMAESINAPCTVIPNPYADDVFLVDAKVAKTRDLVFVGRLVHGKGVHVLLDALGRLKAQGVEPTLTVIGSGPTEADLRLQAEELQLTQQVAFVGNLQGLQLAQALNAHRLAVAPSTWEEPFGVVALEAIACGCVPIVSDSGGLPDAVGGCGVTVPKSDSARLADVIERLLANPGALASFRRRAASHLALHRRDAVAKRYLEVIADACRPRAQVTR